MEFFEWFRTNNNQFITNQNAPQPPANPYQCMQLMHNYVRDVYNLPIDNLLARSAKQLWFNFPHVSGAQFFKQINNRPWNVPLQGDLVFFGYGTDGHVCVFNEGNLLHFTSLDQNFPLNTPVHVQSHTYLNCLGWLHKI